jgi:hypothetical protein
MILVRMLLTLRVRTYPRVTSASARTGLPVPPTSFSGAIISSAPVGGIAPRFASCVTPYFPPEQVVVEREGRVEVVRRARVDTDGLDAHADERRPSHAAGPHVQFTTR